MIGVQAAQTSDEGRESLIRALNEIDPENQARLLPETGWGAGSAPWELIVVVVPTVGWYLERGVPLLKKLIAWARHDIRETLSRPSRVDIGDAKLVHIYGPDNNLLKSILVPDPDAEPEDHTERDRKALAEAEITRSRISPEDDAGRGT